MTVTTTYTKNLTVPLGVAVHEIREGVLMPAGRPAKPRALKLLDGDDKKNPQRVNDAEPIPSALPVEAPGYLSVPARLVWDEVAPDRIAKGVVTVWDVEAFAAFCEALAMLRMAHVGALELAKPGQESMMSKFRQLVAICSTLGGRFGWTPADRAKLSVSGEEKPGGAERLIS
jgi:phage terminase small subunit